MTLERASGANARAAALAILSAVLRAKRPLEPTADAVLSGACLPARDAGFTHAIVNETLRRFGQLEAVIGTFLEKPPLPHKAGPTLEILLAGACELLFLGVAPYAAVDGANRLAQSNPKAIHFKGLINAVLRRIAQEGAAIVAAQDAPRLNTPDWLWVRWCTTFGADGARAIASVHLAEPPLDLTLKHPNDPCSDFPEALRPLLGQIRLAKPRRIETLPGYADGRWWVQDAAASLPARLFGKVTGKNAVDLCAAPGGKTLQLAAAGAFVTALDVAPDRLALVERNLARLALSATCVTGDARVWQPSEPVPCVLLDAPCSATGAIRRHPDLPWNKSAADIVVLAPLQAELLEAAAEMTATDGTLVYAVCSLEPEEGIEQVEAFLDAHPAFRRAPIASDAVFAPAFLTPAGDLQTLPSLWPHEGGMDGFYAARLTRIS